MIQAELSFEFSGRKSGYDSEIESSRDIAEINNLSSISLFASAGIGELGLRASGLNTLCANELIDYRVQMFRENFPECPIISGDIWEMRDEIINCAKKSMSEDNIFLVYATPPCQGMSSNGLGKLKSEVNKGNRPKEDPRNRLIIPTLDIVNRLKPKWILFENVPGMKNTAIVDESGKVVNILSYIRDRLGPEYIGRAEVVACSDFGVPQSRKRLITIYTRDERGKKYFKSNNQSFFHPNMKESVRTLRSAIGHLPSLDAKSEGKLSSDIHPYHRIRPMNPKKYWWVSHTKEGDTAFNNQCISQGCRSTSNIGHIERSIDGAFRQDRSSPIYCVECGSLLPRPTVTEKDGEIRLMKGFHSAYRRMKWDEPARTLTQNFIYEASDNKIHPEQNRVLSVYEAMVLQTIDRYGYKFEIEGKCIGEPKIAEVIGESVPPYLIEKIIKKMVSISFDSCSGESPFDSSKL